MFAVRCLPWSYEPPLSGSRTEFRIPPVVSNTTTVSLKGKLMSASAKALKVCMYYPDPMISFENIHLLNKRATPNAMMKYNLGIQLYKLYNSREHSLEWLHLNLNQILTSRQSCFEIFKSNSIRVGLNALANRLANINGKIELSWLNLSYETFKIKCKKLFITN